MLYKRIIPRLDIKDSKLIKSINLEGLRVIGEAKDFALDYYESGADELLLMDAVASLYGRNHLQTLIAEISQDIFIPITVGGGIRNTIEITQLLRSGADKVAINTAAVRNPKFLRDAADKFGSQSIVLSIEAKKRQHLNWEVMIENGRESTGINVADWIEKACEFGVGEILLTSIDREGTRRGFDTELIEKMAKSSSVPLIASGGMGKPNDLVDILRLSDASGVAMADILHYGRNTLQEIRRFALMDGINVRNVNE